VGLVGRAGLLAVLLLAAGCGSETIETGDEPVGAQLEVTVWPEGAGGDHLMASLTCDPDGGSHPDPVRACDAIEKHADALNSVPGGVACTEIYGGPDQAEVRGTVKLQSILARFNRTNGCEISRWDKLAPLLDLSG
jgi:hypothetical protein